jgi:uncharacterized protein YbjT (DUF2867 family)
MTFTVAVHGVTGTQGSSVARALLADGHAVRGLARRAGRVPHGVDLVAVDVLDTPALTRVYAGVDAVFVHLPTVFDPARAFAQVDSIVAALAGAGVRRTVVNPNLAPPPVEIGVPYVDARVRLAQAVLAAGGAVVAPAAQYMENLSGPWSAPLVLDEGVVAYPLPEQAPVPWVAQDDVARAVVEALTAEAPRPLTMVAGPAALTGPEVADAVSAGLSRPVRWQTITGDRYRDMVAPHLGDEAASGLGALYDAVLTGKAPPPPAPDPSTLVTGATTLADWAKQSPWPYDR